ncbi:EmrB/QacA subfamily drug resistance transporter [Paenibacillus anaericanus]|uniref:MFS transporter n=1 Tax=Paenibacillus anaericanus TaxID=170367 RepID=UPI00277EF639|nr:MFS transporter [Paenibacillus anaericanus]MDQ0089479.1 EmrB/QacA subfamily drug resistance transporter [Paenibacillus anaericanus]
MNSVQKKHSSNWAITLFTIGVFMAALDNGIISAALTTINDSFGVSASWGSWGITLYTLGLAVSVPIIGKLSDRFGRKRLFLIEVALFGIGSLLVALSSSFPMFLLSRLFQAFGGGGIFIIGSSHVLTTLPKEKQGKALGLLGAMNGMAAVLGPNVGSFLLDLTGNWHWLFLINIPIAAVLIILGIPFIMETKASSTKRLDFVGTIILSLAILSLMYGITNLDAGNFLGSFADPMVYGFVLGGVILFILLVLYEKNLEARSGDPILAYSLLSSKVFQWTLLIGFFSGGLLAAVIFIPSFVEQFLGVSAEKSGYWMTPLALASGVGAGLGGVLVDKKGPVFTTIISGVISLVGFALFPLWVTERWEFVIASMIAGVGFGFLLGAPLNVLVSESVDNSNKGSALGTLSLIRQIGLTLSPTLYAGFIAAGASNIGNEIKSGLAAAGISGSGPAFSDISEMSTSQLYEAVEQIPDPTIKEIIMNAIHDSIGKGFGNLYLSAAIISALVIVSILILSIYRKKSLQKEPVKIPLA